jgi:1-acyl-sn-glycerol-3-phosphate acyltransferase
MEVCGILPIDRGNRNKVMQVYQQAIARVEKGECFALAPEGTRQEVTDQLGKFKRGPFEFAINAQMDIVPVIVAGALKVLPKHSIWLNVGKFRRKIIVEILQPVSATEYTMETVEQLQDRVWQSMAPVFARTNAELA